MMNTDGLRVIGPEHWPDEASDDAVGLLDVALDGPELPVLMCGPQWGDRDMDDFAAAEAWPRLHRLRRHGPEPDGWHQVSTGHWQLTLTIMYLPDW